MAIRYVDSAATGSNNGTSWANAFTTLAGAAAVDTAGDIIYVKSTHSESTAGAVTYDWAGTAADPTRIICVSDANEPPTTVATGAVVAVTGANNLTIASNSDYLFVYGIRFKAGDSTNAADISIENGPTTCVFVSCAFELAGNNSGSDFTFNNLDLFNCTFKSANSGSLVSNVSTNGSWRFFGCSIESGGTPGNPFFSSTVGINTIVGFDFTNLGSTSNLLNSATGNVRFTFVNCKMPSSWSGSVNGASTTANSVLQLMNCDSTDTNYRLERKTAFGTVLHETTLVRTGGASDGTTGISWKMTSNADAEWSHQTLDSPEIVQWVSSTGSKTFTVEILHDSATNLTDQDIWVEVMYLGTSGVPLGTITSDAAATYLTTAADQTDSSEVWTTTGLSNPNTQSLGVTVTVNEVGFVHAVVKLAKASKTVYICPKITVS